MRNHRRNAVALTLTVLVAGFPLAASAQGERGGASRVPSAALLDPFGPYGGLAPWSQPWEYDTGSDNDRNPTWPRYQQGGGEQTGGPARNLLPSDRLHIVPR